MVLCTTIVLHPAVGRAADRRIEITNFYVYPDDIHNFNKLGGYVWPDVTELNALVEVQLAGFRGEQKLNVFLVVYGEDEQVIYKEKAKHYLPVGEHDVVFARFIDTAAFFGERWFEMEVELSMKGVKPVKAHTGFSLEGPDEPDVDILELELYRLDGGRFDTRFRPGGGFIFEAQIEIEDNESEVEPSVTIYCAMEEDSFNIGPEFENQQYYEQWDSRVFFVGNGRFLVVARGFLPYLFEETWQYEHPFRVYITLDYGHGVETTDYVRATIYDLNYGDHRYAEDAADRLIRLDRASSWTFRRLTRRPLGQLSARP